MIIHGSSHGLAYFICTISAALIVGLISRYVPSVLRSLEGVSSMVLAVTGINGVALVHMNILLLGGLLAFVWGAAFKQLHRDG
jgi:hypothetical protein